MASAMEREVASVAGSSIVGVAALVAGIAVLVYLVVSLVRAERF